MPIERVKIRARIEVGSFRVETPFILSFNVNRTRGQVSTFDARIKIAGGMVSNMTGGPIKIYAGSDYANNLIFTGIVKKATFSPCFDDPHYLLINLSGADALSLLQNRKYTRRHVSSDTSWAVIDSVTRRGLKSSEFKFRTQPVVLLSQDDLDKAEGITTTSNMSKKYSDFGKPVSDSEIGAAKLDVSIYVD
jgi:hypothetical protein